MTVSFAPEAMGRARQLHRPLTLPGDVVLGFPGPRHGLLLALALRLIKKEKFDLFFMDQLNNADSELDCRQKICRLMILKLIV